MVCPLCKNTNFTIRKKELELYHQLCTTVEGGLTSLELVTFFSGQILKEQYVRKKVTTSKLVSNFSVV